MFPTSRYRVHVCLGPNCVPNGSRRTYAAFEREITRRGLGFDVELMGTSCRNRCETGPSVNVYPGGVFYGRVDEGAAVSVVERHLVGGEPVAELLVSGVAGAKTGRH